MKNLRGTRSKFVLLVLILAIALPITVACGVQPASNTQDTDQAIIEEEPVVEEAEQPAAEVEESTSAESEEPAEPTRITFRSYQDVESMDPAYLAGADYARAYLIYSGLLKFKPGTPEIVGDLATEWELSPDGLRYTFRLHQGVQWHKGYGELTANDVKYSFERIMNPDNESRYAADFASVDRIEVVDDYTVEIYMKEPYPSFTEAVLAYRPGYIVNQKAIEEFGDDYTSNPIGTGPYVWETWEPGNQVVYKRFEDYFGQEPEIDEVVDKLIPEETAAEIALERGDLDLAYFEEPGIQRRIVDNPNLETLETPGPRTRWTYINITKEPWNDINVRRALVYATDRQQLIDTILEGMAVPAYTLLNPNMFAFNNEQMYEYDLQKAKELLAQAGYPDGFDQTFEYVTEPGVQTDIAIVLQQEWKEIGINLDILTLEHGQYQERRTAVEFDFLAGSSARLLPEQYLVPYLSSEGIPYPNILGYTNADQYILEAVKTVDDAKRKALYVQAQKQIQEDVPFLFLAYPTFVLGHRPNIEGVAIGLLTYNVADMKVTE